MDQPESPRLFESQPGEREGAFWFFESTVAEPYSVVQFDEKG